MINRIRHKKTRTSRNAANGTFVEITLRAVEFPFHSPNGVAIDSIFFTASCFIHWSRVSDEDALFNNNRYIQ